MRRLLYLTALSMVATLLFAPAALADSHSQRAQASELDPVAQLGEPASYTDPTAAICSRFASQEEAQQYYETGATSQEQAIMDPNGDGLACTGGDLFRAATDQYAAPVDQYAAADQYTPAADQYAAPADDIAALPATGGPALLPIAGLLLAAGLIGLRMIRRS